MKNLLRHFYRCVILDEVKRNVELKSLPVSSTALFFADPKHPEMLSHYAMGSFRKPVWARVVAVDVPRCRVTLSGERTGTFAMTLADKNVLVTAYTLLRK